MSEPGAMGPTGPEAQHPAMPDAGPPRCLNCGAALTGSFCAQCGQRAVELDAPSWVVIREAVEEAFDVDGRLLRTARALLRPGELTTEYRRGHRAAYLGPLKFFLTAGAVLSTSWIATRGLDHRFYHLGDPIVDPAGYIAAVTRGLLAGSATVTAASWMLSAGRRRLVDEAVFALHTLGALALFQSVVYLLAAGFKLAWGTVERVPSWIPGLPLLLFLPAALACMAWFIAAVRRVHGGAWWRAALEGLVLMAVGAAAVQFVLFDFLSR